MRGDLHCWLWTGAIDKTTGYGVTSERRGEKTIAVTAHRYAWKVTHGREVPDGLDVMHACDVRACVAPHHLSVGTRKRNIGDCRDRGRMTQLVKQGERGRRVKISAEQAAEIRARYANGGVTQEALALEYGVVRFTILRLLKGANRVIDLDIGAKDTDP